MADLTTIDALQALPAVLGAGGGGLGVFWLARTLFRRMVVQYDKLHEAHAKRLEAVADKLGETLTDLRVKVAVVEQKIDALGDDVGVAHRRIEVLAGFAGADIASVQKPNRRNGR